MDEAAASKILEDYLNGQASEADFERALNFLKNAANFEANLAALYRDLDLPGGISHETAQEIMPYYLEPLARAQLPKDERTRFVAHLAQCPSCAIDFLELRGFGTEVNRFRQTEAATDVPVQPKSWPSLKAVIQTFSRLPQKMLFSLSFSPASAGGVRETGSDYQTVENYSEETGEFQVLFEDILEEEAGAYLQAVVTAWRTGPGSCDLQLELTDLLGQARQAGQTVNLTYDGKQFSQKTGQAGETVFFGLEISKLQTLRLEIQITTL